MMKWTSLELSPRIYSEKARETFFQPNSRMRWRTWHKLKCLRTCIELILWFRLSHGSLLKSIQIFGGFPLSSMLLFIISCVQLNEYRLKFEKSTDYSASPYKRTSRLYAELTFFRQWIENRLKSESLLHFIRKNILYHEKLCVPKNFECLLLFLWSRNTEQSEMRNIYLDKRSMWHNTKTITVHHRQTCAPFTTDCVFHWFTAS